MKQHLASIKKNHDQKDENKSWIYQPCIHLIFNHPSHKNNRQNNINQNNESQRHHFFLITSVRKQDRP